MVLINFALFIEYLDHLWFSFSVSMETDRLVVNFASFHCISLRKHFSFGLRFFYENVPKRLEQVR